MDALNDEFVNYQLLETDDIPPEVWKTAKERKPEDEEMPSFVKMDVIWAYLGKKKSSDGCGLRFANLAKVAEIVLVIPHSNAGEERVFSLIRLNRTSYRSSLSLDGTLSSILTVKMHNPEPCHKFEPPRCMLESAKKATRLYNQQKKKK